MRSDGQKNRDAILFAAAEVFANQGFDVALEVIASKAGVSRMTLYRNFADREELALAIFDRNILELEGLAQRLLDDPGGFFILLDRFNERLTDNIGFGELIGRDPNHQPRLAGIRDRCANALWKLVRPAKDAKLLRADLARADIDLLISVFAAAISSGKTKNERIQRCDRASEIVRDGLRR